MTFHSGTFSSPFRKSQKGPFLALGVDYLNPLAPTSYSIPPSLVHPHILLKDMGLPMKMAGTTVASRYVSTT